MTIKPLTEKYETDIAGILHCYDRVIIRGYLQPLGYAKGMTKYLYQEGVRIFDYPKKFAEPLRNEIRANANRLAQENGLEIEFRSGTESQRQEERVQEILEQRGQEPGLVCILSRMERCQVYKPWHDKQSHYTYVKLTEGKCLHYYFYFIDPELGLCHLRVPTWCPFRLQFYFNGHQALAAKLKQAGIGYQLADNAFLQIDDFEQANELAHLDSQWLHTKLDDYARLYCPVVTSLKLSYRWSISQAEYATDIVFRSQERLAAILPPLMETLVQAVKPADIATFLGRKLSDLYQGQMGNRFNKRWLGTRLKHQMGPTTIKMYDKFNLVLRIETTVNDVSFFQQYRQVQHRDGSTSKKFAKMKRTIYSLPPLAETLLAVNTRYLKFISAIDTPEVGHDKLQRLTETVEQKNRRYKGFNLLAEEDASLFRLLLNGQFLIQGFSNGALRQHLSDKSSAHMSRLLKRLRVHGIIRKVQKRHRYYLTQFGQQTAVLALKLREMVIIPHLAFNL